MNDKLFISEKVKVGFNLRSDTYTGKLGYVIGFDGKKWRKEPSWDGWRLHYTDSAEFLVKKQKAYDEDVTRQTSCYNGYITELEKSPNKYGADHYYRDYTKDGLDGYLKRYIRGYNDFKNYNPNLGRISDDKTIIPMEFDNVPTEGFVLNKKAGGYSSGWNHRSTYCRVYDPRGFEFEISIPNLLFILQECNSMKGKGLEGEFVYAWDGKDLVLLPTSSEDYKLSANFTKLQSGKVGVKDLVEGCTYKTKNMEEYVYLGRFNWLEDEYQYSNSEPYTKCVKQHIFYNTKGTSEYNTLLGTTSMANFVQKVTDTPVSNYADLLDKYNESKYSGVLKDTTFNDLELPKKYHSRYSSSDREMVNVCLLEISDNKYEVYSVEGVIDSNTRSYHNNSYNYSYDYKYFTFKARKTVELKTNGDFEVKSMKPKELNNVTPKDIEGMNFKVFKITKDNKNRVLKF